MLPFWRYMHLFARACVPRGGLPGVLRAVFAALVAEHMQQLSAHFDAEGVCVSPRVCPRV